MIQFPHTRMRRVSVRLSELTLGQAGAICDLPATRHELTATALLQSIASSADAPLPRYVTNPLLWTVQERTHLLCIYLAHVTDDGPNFSLNNGVDASARVGLLTDYLDMAKDSTADEISLGEVALKERIMRPLLGLHSQVLEVLCKSRADWCLGAMACQLYMTGAEVPDWLLMSDLQQMEWVKARMDKIREMPESLFEELYFAWMEGNDKLAHFFVMDFDKAGIIYLPHDAQGKGVGLGPARFLAHSCVSGTAKEFFR